MPRNFSAIDPAVRAIVQTILLCKPHQVIPGALLVEDLGADSLDTVEISVAIEDELGIEFTDDEWDKVRTVGDAVALTTRKMKEKQDV